MIDLDIESNTISDFFNAENKFDSDFIRMFLDGLKNSTIEFQPFTESERDKIQIRKATNILIKNILSYPKNKILVDIIQNHFLN